ncbi:MAG: hypothetical protein ACTSU5_22055 [Promethearchaeota archaeon]
MGAIEVQSPPIFDYEIDWFNYFESYLRKEKTEHRDRIPIKTNIVESNQTLEELARRFPQKIQVVESRDSYFFNVVIRGETGTKYYLYVNTNSKDSRFWIIHNIEYQKKVKREIRQYFQGSYLQDKIYLPREAMEKYRLGMSSYTLGMSLKFEKKIRPVTRANRPNDNGAIQDVGFSLKCWTRNPNTVGEILDAFDTIKFPVNYRSLNCVFLDENHEILLKENLFNDGSLTIDRGRDLSTHLEFVKKIRSDYEEKISRIEEYRIDLNECRGDLFQITLNEDYDPKAMVSTINQNHVDFRLYCFFLYRVDSGFQYLCIDEHTGDKFFLTAFKDHLYLNLNPRSCGNIVLRLFTRVQQFIDSKAQLSVGENRLSWGGSSYL